MVAGTGPDDPPLKAAIVQDADSGAVLMLGWMDEAALAATRATGQVTFWSRSRRQLWVKGETSGNSLKLVDIRADCDDDALLVRARPAGPTCHTGTSSCFGDGVPAGTLTTLEARIAARATAAPEESYTARLLAAGPAQVARKVGEEGLELALAGVVENDQAVLDEAADLLYHMLVLLKARGLPFERVLHVLASRL